jgi:DNA-binding MarR family transcriptional regulator
MARQATEAPPRQRAPRTFYLIKRLQAETQLLLEEALHGFELTPTMYMVLSLVEERGDMSSAELARRLRTAPQSAGELIAALERRSLVERRTDGENRRVLRISISRRGRAMLRRCDRLVDRLEAELLAPLGGAELERFRQAMRSLAERMEQRRRAAER